MSSTSRHDYTRESWVKTGSRRPSTSLMSSPTPGTGASCGGRGGWRYCAGAYSRAALAHVDQPGQVSRMSNDLVVRGGTIITAADSFVADVGIRAGRIVEIGESLPRASQEIDAAGLQVLPGGVDVHTHLDVDVGTVHTADDFESGTAAAACGGITTICDYAWQGKGQSLADTIAAWSVKARGRAHVDYGFHIILSDVTDERIAEIPAIVGAGYPSFKVFTIREFGIGDEALLRVLRAARRAGAIVNVHCENSEMLDLAEKDMIAAGRLDPRFYAESRPALAEAEATRRVIDYAALVGAEVYIVHLSCVDALEAVSAARKRGVR